MAMYFVANRANVAIDPPNFGRRKDFLTGENCDYVYSDKKIVETYRLSRPMIEDLVDGYANSQWGKETDRSKAISNTVQVFTLIFSLFFLLCSSCRANGKDCEYCAGVVTEWFP